MRIETTEDAQQRVRQGERWLDDHVPDWEQRIDTTILNIASARCCVLGQLGATGQGRFVIAGDFHDDCERYGFSIKAQDYTVPNYGKFISQAIDSRGAASFRNDNARRSRPRQTWNSSMHER
jgi:hypothetical protein